MVRSLSCLEQSHPISGLSTNPKCHNNQSEVRERERERKGEMAGLERDRARNTGRDKQTESDAKREGETERIYLSRSPHPNMWLACYVATNKGSSCQTAYQTPVLCETTERGGGWGGKKEVDIHLQTQKDTDIEEERERGYLFIAKRTFCCMVNFLCCLEQSLQL